ncbi:MAG: hypothetical protein SH818_06395 [Saprospiraceae bacterium]|nr:hypothetical protein [Saprospiraceae bacterium]
MYRILSLVGFLFWFTCDYQLVAQEKPREYSPYSRLGIGDLTDPNFSALSQLGGIAAGFNDKNILNFSNPAALGSLRNTAFEAGVSAKFTNLKNNDLSKSFFGGGLDYLALGVPVYNPINEALDRIDRKFHWGMLFALKPYSHVGYDIAQIDSISGTGRYKRSYTGSGGTYEFKWSNGIEYRKFSAGLSLGYLFGKMSYRRDLDLLSVVLPYSTIFLDEISMNGFKWNLGIQYKINLSKLKEGELESDKTLSIGLYGQSSQSFSTLSDHVYRRQLIVSAQVGVIDTVRNEINLEGSGTLPGELHLGFYYNQRYKFQFGGQLSLVSWSNYKNTAKPEILKNSSNLSLGLAYCPDIESLNNLLKRTTYRLGVKIGNDPRSFNDTQLKNFAVTFGLGVPFVFQRKVSFANLGIEMGSLGIQDKLKSNYVQLKLGFTLNDDEWFLKRKYN